MTPMHAELTAERLQMIHQLRGVVAPQKRIGLPRPLDPLRDPLPQLHPLPERREARDGELDVDASAPSLGLADLEPRVAEDVDHRLVLVEDLGLEPDESMGRRDTRQPFEQQRADAAARRDLSRER